MIDILNLKGNKVSKNLQSKFFTFYGEQGTWKTTVASQFPDPLLIGGEIGYSFIEGIRAVPIENWSNVKEIYRQLKSPKAKEIYKTIIFDTISNLYQMCYKYVLGQLGINDPGDLPYGQGWRAIREEFNIIKDFSKLGYGMIFIAHAKESEKKGEISIKTDLDTMPASLVEELSDFVFYVRKEYDEEGGCQVYAYSNLPQVSCKSRLKTFPKRILFDRNVIETEVEEAIKRECHNVTDDNIRIVNELSLKDLQQKVIDLVKKTEGTKIQEDAYQLLLNYFNGIPVSQTDERHRDKLIAIADELISLLEGINV